jgi:predicted transporter
MEKGLTLNIMQFIAISWHESDYPPSYIGLANFFTITLVVVVLIEAAIFVRKKWKNKKK